MQLQQMNIAINQDEQYGKESRLGEGDIEKKNFDAGHSEFEIPEVHPGRDIQMALEFKRQNEVIDTDLEIINTHVGDIFNWSE